MNMRLGVTAVVVTLAALLGLACGIAEPLTDQKTAQKVFEDLILLSAELPASCEMLRLTPISAVNERGSVNLPSNPFVSSDREIIRFLAGTAGVEEYTVVKVMGVQYYVEPAVHDEFDYFGFEFDTEEHADIGTARLASRGINDPERFVVFSGGRFVVYFFRDDRRKGTDCFFALKDMIAEIVM